MRKMGAAELDQKISKAQEEVSRTKKQYDRAIEELSNLLEQRDDLHRGLDGGRISLEQWDYTWQGNAIWDGGSVTVDCNYQAKMTFRPGDAVLHGKEIQRLEMEEPGFTDKDVIRALQNSLCAELDGEFEDYCTEDDFYEPVAEDFEAEYYARKWAEERGLELVNFEGEGSDGGYEPKHRRW